MLQRLLAITVSNNNKLLLLKDEFDINLFHSFHSAFSITLMVVYLTVQYFVMTLASYYYIHYK